MGPLTEFIRFALPADERPRHHPALQYYKGQRSKKPQGWIYNCENAHRQLEFTEFIA